MLPAAARMHRRDDFVALARAARFPAKSIIVSADCPPGGVGSARIGFAVSRAVGNSVVRHRVTRRLRHLVAARLERLPAGTRILVRARPGAASASFTELGAELDRALARLSARKES